MKTIKLTQGKVALVDNADFEVLSKFKWYALKVGRRFYAARNIRKPDGTRTIQLLHQFLLPGVPQIDHQDGNGLNDQMHNIRPATHQQNARGFQQKRLGASSKFRGVTWDRKQLKWLAYIKADGKVINLGRFADEANAGRARDIATLKYYGPDAHFNFPI